MQLLITFITVVAGLIFSVAVAIAVEEFIFGQIFKIFFAQPKPALAANLEGLNHSSAAARPGGAALIA